MSLRVDQVQLEIIINNDPARQAMRQLSKELVQAQNELKKLPKDTEAWIQKSKEIDGIKNRMDDLKRSIGVTGMTMKELDAHARDLKASLAQLRPNDAAWKTLNAELEETKARINQLRNGSKEVPLTLGRIADGFNRYFAMVTAVTAAFAGTAYTIKQLITNAAELEDSMADIARVTGMTTQEVKELNRELGKIDTRTSRQDLRAMAVVAGQLGIAKADVLGFVESVDKLNVIMGGEIAGGAEEVAKTLGTLRNVLTDQKTKQVDEDLMRIGNSLTQLAQAGFATAPVMADFANRIGGIGISLGLSSDEVLGLSATLQELNVSTERGGTAVSRILQKMTTNTETFAKIAGMPMKEFTNLVNSDLMGAFEKVLEGSQQGGQSATLLSGIIKELEVQGAGASEVFAKLGGNMGMLREKVDLAGAGLSNTNAITEQFNIKNATLGATIAKLQKDLYSLVTMEGVINFFKRMVYSVVLLVNGLKTLPEIIERYKVALTIATGAALTWVAAKTKSIQVALVNNLTMKEGILLKAKDAIVTQALAIKEGYLAATKDKVTIASKAAAVAQWAWNAAVSANPIGVVIAGLTALVAGIKAYDKYNSESMRLEAEKKVAVDRLAQSNERLGVSYEEINGQIRDLSKLSVKEKEDLAKKIELTLKQAEAELMLQEAKQQDIIRENARATGWQKFTNVLLAGGNAAAAASMNMADAAGNAMEAGGKMDEGLKKMREGISNLRNASLEVKDIMNAEAAGDAIGSETLGQLNEKLAKYQTARDNAKKGSEDYLRIQLKIKDVNKELAKYQASDEAGPVDPKKLEKKADEYKSLLAGISDFEMKQLEARLTGFQRELAATQGKYDEQIAKAKQYLVDQAALVSPEKKKEVEGKIDSLEAQKHKVVKDLMLANEKKFTTDVMALADKFKTAQLREYDREIAQIASTYDEKISAQSAYIAEMEAFYAQQLFQATGNAEETKRLEEEKAAFIAPLYANLIDLEKLKEDDKAAYIQKKTKETADKEKEIKDKARQDDLDKAKENQQKIKQFAVDMAQLTVNTVYDIENQKRADHLDAQMYALNTAKENELANKNLTEEQRTAIDAKYKKKEAAIKTKAWKDEQKASEQQAIINGALAVTNILATMPWATFGVAQALAIGSAVASTIAQLAKIRAAKPPQFASGGYTGDGGVMEPAGIVHRGEYVIPAWQMNDPEVKKVVAMVESKRINRGYMNGGAVAQWDVQSIISAIRVASTQAGIEMMQNQTREIIHQIDIPGLIEKSLKASVTVPAGGEMQKIISELSRKLEALDKLNKTLETGVRSHIVYQDIVDADETMKSIKLDTSR